MSGGMVLITASTPSFPPGSIPICDLALDSGTYTVDACGLASRVRGYAIDAGPGINITYTQGIPRISTDATVARTDAPGATTAGATVSKVVPWIALILALIAICLAIYLKKAAAPLGDYDNPPHV
jgi:hypothetical protein